jgi:hypothetical protein
MLEESLVCETEDLIYMRKNKCIYSIYSLKLKQKQDTN